MTLIKFVPVKSTDRESIFLKYKSALIEIVEETFGWDESFQNERFKTHYEPDWFFWVETNAERVGYICFFKKEAEIHLSLLIVDAEKRDRGYGRLAMIHLHELARLDDRKVTLSSFRRNVEAIKFYKRLGYIEIGGDEHFVDMALPTP